MDRNKLDNKVSAAEHRLNLALAELDALADRKKVTKTFRTVLRTAVLTYQKESTALVKALDKEHAQAQQALIGQPRYYAHRRGLSMAAAGPTERFLRVLLTYSEPRPDGYYGEWLWARKIGMDMAKLDNIPFYCLELSLGDLVRVKKNGEVGERLEHGARTRQLQYADPQTQTEEYLRRRFHALQDRLEPYEVVAEMMHPGQCCVSVPQDIDDSQLALLAEQSGAVVLNREQCNYEPPDVAAI